MVWTKPLWRLPVPDESKPSLIGVVALIVIGLLILIPSGLCTGIMIVGAFWAGFDPSSFEMVFLALLYGGPFVVLGGFFLWLGIRQKRRRSGSH
jgi:hypothetical protein